MLSQFIKNIRAKPESVRRGITLGASLGITGIIGFFWLISFLNYSTEVLTAKPKIESPTSFLGKMSTLIGESYANVRAKMGTESGGFVKTASDDATTTPAGLDGSTDGSATSTDEEVIIENFATSSATGTGTSNTNTSNNSSIKASSSPQNSKSLGEILNTKK